MGKKFWTIKNITTQTGEIMLYGPISETTWWGDEVTPKQFSSELEALGEVTEINVRINSPGGDVFAAQAINSLLRAHKARINVYIDGIAASAATVVAMAGDMIHIPSSAMMMIHDPLTTLYGMYNTKDLQECIEVLKTVKESIMNAYVAKTGKDKEELFDLMDNETWLTGEQAVEQGFADKLTDSVVESYMDGSMMIVNNIQFDVSKFSNVPKMSMKAPGYINISNINKGSEGKVTLETIKNQYPEVYNEVYKQGRDEGVTNERNRIKAIEDVAMPGFDNMIQEAKYKNAISAEELAISMIKASRDKGINYLNNAQQDASQLDNVEGDSADSTSVIEAEKQNIIDRMVSPVNKIRGGSR